MVLRNTRTDGGNHVVLGTDILDRCNHRGHFGIWRDCRASRMGGACLVRGVPRLVFGLGADGTTRSAAVNRRMTRVVGPESASVVTPCFYR